MMSVTVAIVLAGIGGWAASRRPASQAQIIETIQEA